MAVDYFSPRTFNSILNEARLSGVRGAWSGSAFRSHPCGIVRGNIKLTNYWHVDDICSICITDGDGWSMDICRESCAHGNPHPQPINGRSISVWSNGRWQGDEYRGALETTVLAILRSAHEHILRSNNWKVAEASHAAHVKRILAAQASAIALAKAAKVPA